MAFLHFLYCGFKANDNNSLGIALCHTYFGNLYKKANLFDDALCEYEASYDIMKDFKDEWHMLNALVALAGIYIEKGDNIAADKYLAEAKDVANKIRSKEYLAEIYTLYYKMMKRRGEYRDALVAHEHAIALKDSLIDMEKVNRMKSISFNIERGQQSRRMMAANDLLRSERSTRHIGYVIFGVFAFLLIGIIGLLINTRNINARSHAALKKLNEMRESFFTNITHEFRTPLTVILGLSRDLQKDDISSNEVKDTGATIERQGTRMLHLINQLLDISKIRSEIGSPDWKHGNVVAYIGMIVETFEEYAKKRGVKLQFFSQNNDIETDFVPDYISKILSNLLSNALKFTPEAGTINVSLWSKDEKYYIDIADSGHGIPEESLPHIFEAFYQSGNVPDCAGSGVGLALVSQIMKTLNGSINVESKVGCGTTFHIALPIKHGVATGNYEEKVENNVSQYTKDLDDGSSKIESELRSSSIGTETSILIVEDNRDVATYIGKQLVGKYNVIFASNGEQGLALAKEKLPDAIITDLMMPKLDGLELIKKIREDMLTCHIPIIVITAKVTENDRIRVLDAGADAYLVKPFSNDELLTRVSKLLEQRCLLRQIFSQHDIIGTQNKQDKSSSASLQYPSPATSSLDIYFINRLTDSIYLLLNANKPIDVNAVAARMNMSYSQLYRKLSVLTDLTPVQYIQRVKVSKAKRMLSRNPEMSLNIVAEQCGFSDYSNFVRAFKNVLNLTPTQYVRNITSNNQIL